MDEVYSQPSSYVTIEQTLQAEVMEDKTVQELQLDLKYNGKKWKAVSFSAKQVL